MSTKRRPKRSPVPAPTAPAQAKPAQGNQCCASKPADGCAPSGRYPEPYPATMLQNVINKIDRVAFGADMGSDNMPIDLVRRAHKAIGDELRQVRSAIIDNSGYDRGEVRRLREHAAAVERQVHELHEAAAKKKSRRRKAA